MGLGDLGCLGHKMQGGRSYKHRCCFCSTLIKSISLKFSPCGHFACFVEVLALLPVGGERELAKTFPRLPVLEAGDGAVEAEVALPWVENFEEEIHVWGVMEVRLSPFISATFLNKESRPYWNKYSRMPISHGHIYFFFIEGLSPELGLHYFP